MSTECIKLDVKAFLHLSRALTEVKLTERLTFVDGLLSCLLLSLFLVIGHGNGCHCDLRRETSRGTAVDKKFSLNYIHSSGSLTNE